MREPDECLHSNTEPSYEYIYCSDCGCVLMGHTSNKMRDQSPKVWWRSRNHAEYFYRHGSYLAGIKPNNKSK